MSVAPGVPIPRHPSLGPHCLRRASGLDSHGSHFVLKDTMSLRKRTRPGLGIIEPCLPSPAKAAPAGSGWIHEIKHDGFRIMARRGPAGVQLITRAGNDFASRFPFIAMAIGKLPIRSCLIDGEAIVCDENGLAVFDLIDLLELHGRDLRGEPIEKRKELLAKLLHGSHLSIVLNEHFEEDGAIVFREACRQIVPMPGRRRG